MENTALFTRADIVDCQLFLSNAAKRQDLNSSQWSTDSSIQLLGRPYCKKYDRCTFEVDGFDKSMDYFVDLGDGHGKRILNRKFHYQYMSAGDYTIQLYIKAGDNMIPVSDHTIRVEESSLYSTLRSISLF